MPTGLLGLHLLALGPRGRSPGMLSPSFCVWFPVGLGQWEERESGVEGPHTSPSTPKSWSGSSWAPWGPQFPQAPPNQASNSHPALGAWSPHPAPGIPERCYLSRPLMCCGGCRGGPQSCVPLEPVNVPFGHVGSLQV